jgi:hypothetical protein
MNDEIQGIWKETVLALIEILPWNLPGVDGENHEKPQSG